MASLLRILFLNLAIGAGLGVCVGFAFLYARGDLDLFEREPIAALLVLWAFAASMGLGALGTGLAMPEE